MTKRVLPFPADRRVSPGRKSHGTAAARPAPLSDAEIVVSAYLAGRIDVARKVFEACDRLEVAVEPRCSRLEAAVGQVLIQTVQQRLPQWMTSRDGQRIYGREYRTGIKGPPVAVIPQLLFEINWADSAPGISWPESYHLAYVPGHHRYVVVASQDGTDTWGCTDQALGHFAPRERRLVGARRIITEHWRELLDSYGQEPWAYFFASGMVDETMAERWRKHVWPKERDEDLG